MDELSIYNPVLDDLSIYNPEGSDLRRGQLKMLEILEVFDTICKKHNIDYWIAAGTLLGARRHAGFIPWDDDLDVVVLQKDSKKLLSILKEELPENLKLQARGTDKKYWFHYAKIRDTRSKYHEANRNFEYEGIFIDIFFIEPVPSIGFKRIIDKFIFSEIHLPEATSIFQKIKYTVMLSFMPIVRLLIALTRAYFKYFSRTKAYTYAYGIFFYSAYNMEYFYPVGEIMFEGKKFKAPSNVDKYLIDNFDTNFMVIPQPRKRKRHSSKIEFF